jgi:predicted cupin superfamily sugar epimerase
MPKIDDRMTVTGPLDPEVARLVDELGLAPHPEGGFYRETYRSQVRVPTPRGERTAMTVIHFVLPPGVISALHRVFSDELWVHSGGGGLELHTVSPGGTWSRAVLDAGSHAVVPACHWQGARPAGPRFAHVTCVVAPGFEFADFELAKRAELERKYPALPTELLDLALP